VVQVHLWTKTKGTLKDQTSILRFRAFQPKNLQKGLAFTRSLAKKKDISLGGSLFLPSKTLKFTLLRSPHVNKQSRDQLEIRTYSRLLEIKSLEREKVFAFVEELNKQCPVGITLKTSFGFPTPGKGKPPRLVDLSLSIQRRYTR
jgi:small subunit ribosomal protein S10